MIKLCELIFELLKRIEKYCENSRTNEGVWM
jgi:hypothetical protein